MVKNPPAKAGEVKDVDSVPESGRSLEGGLDNPLLAWRILWTEETGRL